MPFERYLQADADDEQHRTGTEHFYSDYGHGRYSLDDHPYPHGIQFQIPQFMYNGPPILAPGGGAEVLPAGLLDSADSFASSWLANSGFAPFTHSRHPNESSLSSTLQYGPYTLPHSIPYHHVDSSPYLSSQPLPPSPSPIRAPSSSAADIPYSSNFTTPSHLGFPVYSSPGFDLLSILSRVASRPHPNIVLGAIDSSCSFTIADVRRHDSPIIYASPAFYCLTWYQEHEVLGRNCRFLQAPDGNVQKGEERRFVPPDAVATLKKALSADKECQTTIINYRKGGHPFINLVTVIPIRGGVSNRPEEADEVVYHVGFQVDLTKQPNAISDKLHNGSYIVNYSTTANGLVPTPLVPLARGRPPLPPDIVLSKHLRSLIADAKFTSSVPFSTSVNIPPSSSTPDKPDTHDGNQLLHMLLLEKSPDFIVVLSLKGAFLYVAPSVRLVLGYEPEELVGKSISDYCHPADLVPLMRELKESSITPSTTTTDTTSPNATSSHSQPSLPKTVDLLFRARTKSTAYAWIECRGRLHVEPGKGRKAIILSGRNKWMPSLSWRAIARAGGLGDAQEVWGMVSADGTVLVTSATVRDMLGWSVSEIIGKTLSTMVVSAERGQVEAAIQRANREEIPVPGQARSNESEPDAMICTILRKDHSTVSVRLVFYRPPARASAQLPPSNPIPAQPLVIQLTTLGTLSNSNSLIHSEVKDVFEELNTSRGSSWQYELQQLRFANQRLCEEVDALEVSRPGYQQQHPQPQPQRQQQQQRQHHQHRHPQQQQVVDTDWATLTGNHSNTVLSSSSHINPGSIHIPGSSSLKRAWNSGDGPI